MRMNSVLGRAVEGTLAADEIEIWPLGSNVKSIQVAGGELSALCPVTGNPDIYSWEIQHGGFQEFESKALKMYLMRYRDVGISCAALASSIASELTKALGESVQVNLHQQTRGGMRLHAEAEGL